jgi:DNA/RNA endonuclease YhcR with UshA esterase domain
VNKKLILAIISLTIVLAFSMSIGEFRNLQNFQTGTVEGVVTVLPNTFGSNIFFIQDKTGGVNVYASKIDFSKLGLKYGDLVKVTGYKKVHKMNTELVVKSLNDVKILSKSVMPKPKNISTKDINNEAYEGLLVHVKAKVVSIDAPKIFLDDGSGEGMMYLREGSGLSASMFKVGDIIQVTGVLGQYNFAHELWPRNKNDIISQDRTPPAIKYVTPFKNFILVKFTEDISPKSVIKKNIVLLKEEVKSVELVEPDILKIDVNYTKSEHKLILRFITDKNGNRSFYLKKTFTLQKVKRVLFDNSHSETAGNADWTINGGYSQFADSLKELGYTVDELTSKVSYYNLLNYSIYIIPEPNTKFTSSEEEAIINYIKDGGSVFFISDHGNSDRNQNGYDSISIFNDFVKQLGFEFVGNNLYIPKITQIIPSPITEGVKSIGLWNGSTIKVIGNNVKVAVKANNMPYVIYGTFGKGKFVAIGDSSPFDDGLSISGKNLYDGWDDQSDKKLALNICQWLQK